MEDSIIMEEKRRVLLRNRKIFLIFTKYLSHILGFGYIIYTLLGFFGIDAVEIGYLVQLSVLPWFYAFSASVALEFCYVHRLPLYYIAIDELALVIDNYYTIPLDSYNLFLSHLFLVGLLIFGYTYYYVKNHKRNTTAIY